MAQIEKKTNFNLPNVLTIFRIFLVPVIVTVLLVKFQGRVFLALGFFLLAAVTDFIDGYLARSRGEITTLGILLDPIADKLLISSSFIALVELGLAPAWAVVIIVGREIAVTGMRSIAASRGVIIPASSFGKKKMASEVITISLLILTLRYPVLKAPGEAFLYVTVLFALISAGDYIIKFAKTSEW